MLLKTENDSDLRRSLKAFLDPGHFPVVLVLAAVFAVVSIALPQDGAKQHDVLLGLFGVTGTMAALILPTAALFESFVSRATREIDEKLLAKDAPRRDHIRTVEYGLRSIDELQKIGERAWQGSLYIFCAFLLIVPALFLSRDRLIILGVSLQEWLMAISLAFLVTGSFLYCAVALWVYQFKSLENRKLLLNIKFKHMREQERKDDSHSKG